MSVDRLHVRCSFSPRNRPKVMFVLPISIASSISSHPYAKRNHYTVFCVKARATFRARASVPASRTRPCPGRPRRRSGRSAWRAADRAAPAVVHFGQRISQAHGGDAMTNVEILQQLAVPADTKLVLLVLDGLGG